MREDARRGGAESGLGDGVAGDALGPRVSEKLAHVTLDYNLHLAVSMRSFRSENVSLLVKKLLDLEAEEAPEVLRQVDEKYPIVITRDLRAAKQWVGSVRRNMARRGGGSFGMVVWRGSKRTAGFGETRPRVEFRFVSVHGASEVYATSATDLSQAKE